MKSFQGLSGYLHGGRAPAGTRGLADVVDTLLQDGVLQHWLGRYAMFFCRTGIVTNQAYVCIGLACRGIDNTGK
jgi:hypothetical protein